MALATPWYALGGTSLPPPWDTMSALFYWGGFEGFYSPPLIPGSNTRTYNIPWSEMKSTLPKDVYMTCIAMCFLSLFSMILLCFLIFFGFVFPQTERVIKIMFFGQFKWICVILCYINFLLVLLSWVLFFAFSYALSEADLCPGSNTYVPSPFPFSNKTTHFEPLWCDSFANNRFTYGAVKWVWAPSLGWIFALISTVFSFTVLSIMLTVPTRDPKSDYQRIK